MSAKESIVTRVQKLLNLAMDEGATEAERQLAQERADKLMVEHMIAQADLKANDPKRGRVTHTEWSFEMSYEFRQDLENLLWAVMNHTQCRYTSKYDYTTHKRRLHVVGMPEQIAYAERLWMIVFTELTRNMNPSWDPALSMDANVYHFVKAGVKWRNIHEIAWKNVGDTTGLPDPYPADKQTGWGKVYGGDGGRLKRAYHREQKRLGEERENHTQRHGAYRASYVQSFSSTIRKRLNEMARKSQEDLTVSDADRYALAVQGTKEQTDAEFYRLFPEFDPEVQKRESAKAHAAEQLRRANLTEAQRRAEDERQRRAYARARKHYDRIQDKSYDANGWSRGTKVASKVNLNNDRAAGHKKKEVGE